MFILKNVQRKKEKNFVMIFSIQLTNAHFKVHRFVCSHCVLFELVSER